MLDNIYNLRRIFHKLIIAIFILSFIGCGVKKSPYYQEEAPLGDDDVEFIITDPSTNAEENVQESVEESVMESDEI